MKWLLLLLLMSLLTACNTGEEFGKAVSNASISKDFTSDDPVCQVGALCNQAEEEGTDDEVDNEEENPDDKIVCDPFSGNGSSGGIENGLEGELRLLKENLVVHRNNIENYLSEETSFATGAKIFLSNVNIPTRIFDQGFPYGDGLLVTDQNGIPLVEWFSVSFESKLVASESGHYQFATISDDGVQLYLNDELIINHPKVHAPTVDCSAKDTSVYLEAGDEVKLKLNYFQGPRYRIALQLFWRKVDPAHMDELTYATCGVKTYSPHYPNNDGFSIIPANAFVLGEGKTNPCQE